MTLVIVINVVFAAAVLATIVGMHLWAIRSQHHDLLGAAERRVAVEHAGRAHRSRSAHATRHAGGRVYGPGNAIE
jgi:nitrogen fixation-related uncharacterized protein